jgi:hypothetical protein
MSKMLLCEELRAAEHTQYSELPALNYYNYYKYNSWIMLIIHPQYNLSNTCSKIAQWEVKNIVSSLQLHMQRPFLHDCHKKKLCGFSPQANYTDRATETVQGT